MNGIHDLGGMHGFGVVPHEDDPPHFEHPFERRAFALTNLALAHVRNADRFRHALERLPVPTYLSGYYRRWLAGLELLLTETGHLDSHEIEGRAAAIARQTLREAVRPGAVVERFGGRTALRSTEREVRFHAGDRVRTRNLQPAGHTRLPAYARCKVGEVTEVHPAFVFPDTNAHDLGERPQAVYTVTFTGEELWGPESEPGIRVGLDLFEDYLDPAEG